MLEDLTVHGALMAKGYRSEVITALIPFGAKQLQKMDSIDDVTFGRFSKSGSANSAVNTAAFNEANDALKAMGRTNVVFATNMAERYKKDPEGYRQFMDNLSKSMQGDPALSKKVTEMAKSGNAKQLTDLADAYQDDPGAAYVNLIGKKTETVAVPVPSPEKAAPSSAVIATGKPLQKRTPQREQAREEQLAHIKKQAGTATAKPDVSPSESLLAGEKIEEPVSGQTAKGPLTPEQAKERFSKMMADPKNELAVEIRRNKVEDDIMKRLDQDPNLVKNFGLPVNQNQYLALLKDNKKSDFLSAFGGPDIPEVSQAGMMGGFGEIGTKLQEMFSGILGGGGGPNSFGGMMSQFKDIVGRVFGGGASSLFGGGTNVTKMLNSVDNNLDPAYLGDKARLAQDNLKSMNPEIRKHGQRVLAEMGVAGRGDIHELQQGHTHISHVDIVTREIKDKEGHVTGTEKYAKAHTKPYANVEELKKSTAANAPSIQPAKKVAGSDLADDELRRKGAQTEPVAPLTPIVSTPST